LLDTCTFLWIIVGAKELSPAAKERFADPTNEVLLSVVSLWELSIKHALGRLPLPSPMDRFLVEQRERHGIAVLPLHEGAVLTPAQAPAIAARPV
jgi:PIN domain nuclease of toxin-antitoxin system